MNTDKLKEIIREEIKIALQEGESGEQNYMFFQNLHTIKKMIDKMLMLNPQEVDALLSNGHAWAVDHISTSTDDITEVGSWLCNELSGQSLSEMDVNDPIMMKLRTPKSVATISKPSSDKLKKLKMLLKQREQIMFDMEQEAEPAGGPIADTYADKLMAIDSLISKLK